MQEADEGKEFILNINILLNDDAQITQSFMLPIRWWMWKVIIYSDKFVLSVLDLKKAELKNTKEERNRLKEELEWLKKKYNEK